MPTIKAGGILAIVSALAAGFGGASGLESLLSADGGAALSARSAADGPGRISRGIAPAVTEGPFHPVVGDFDYGEADARFGASRDGHRHEGQDVFSKPGAPLVAVTDGVVVEEAGTQSALSGGRGNFVATYSPADDRTYVYLHMQHRSPLRQGDAVRAGDRVGAMGCTGSCYGTHLHFEVRLGRGTEAKPIDPLPLLRHWLQAEAAG